MNLLSLAVNQWNLQHPGQILMANDINSNKKSGLGKTLFLAYHQVTGWKVRELGYGFPILAFFARIARYLHISYHDTRLNWNLRQVDWINRPKKPVSDSENPWNKFSHFFGLKNVSNLRVKPNDENNVVDPDSLHTSKGTPLIEMETFLKKMPNITKDNRSQFFARENEDNRLLLFVELNSLLGKLKKKANDQTISKEEKEKYLKGIKKLELAAATIIKISYKKKSAYAKHASNLAEFPSVNAFEYFKRDGIMGNGDKNEKTVMVTDKIKVTHHSALNQAEAANHLCGYYALFFLLQSISGKDFNDRNEFKKYQSTWCRMIMEKRALGSIYLENGLQIAPYLQAEEGPIGLSPYEIEFLLKKSDIPQNTHWRIIELENLDLTEGSEWTVDPLIAASSSEKIPPHALVSLIVKLNGHYYFFQAKRENDEVHLDCAHSLENTVPGLNPETEFSFSHVSDLVEKIVLKQYAESKP